MYGYYQPRSIEYVNGRQSAEVYTLPPNSEAILMDSNEAIFYLKRTDAAGMSTIRTYKFEEVIPKTTEYVTKEEFESLRAAYESLIAKQTSTEQPLS